MKIFKLMISICYFISLNYLVFLTARRQVFKISEARAFLNVIPVVKTIEDFRKLKSHSSAMEDYFFNFFGNIALFIPYSLILVFVFNIYSGTTVILTAVFLSVLIETLQFIFGLGVADVDDVLLNVSGAFIGWLIAKLIVRFKTNCDFL